MLCEALTFTGLRDELPRLMAPVHTIIAPTNEAWAKMDESVRARIRGSCASFSSGTCALASPRCRIYGNDCAHCGPRFPPPPPICAETCNWASDADCDETPAPARSSARPWADGMCTRPSVTCCKETQSSVYKNPTCPVHDRV